MRTMPFSFRTPFSTQLAVAAPSRASDPPANVRTPRLPLEGDRAGPVSKRRKPKKPRPPGPKVHGGPRLVTPDSAASPRGIPRLPADMRARAGFAACLWQLGEREEAVAHRRDMLRLNPNDNQGIRYTLLGCLLAMGSDERAAEILDDAEYSDDATATWPYSQTLLAYRRTGLGERAEALLSEARRTNPHVPAYLLGKKALPEELPEMVGFGDESEAIAYPADNLEAWRSTPGALEWLGKATV